MKFWTKLFAVLAIVAMVGVARAADDKPGDKPADKPVAKKPLKGDVVKVDGSKLVISAGKKTDKKEVTVETNDKTVVTIEGKEAKLADLKAGQKVLVTPDTGVAEKIEVPMPKVKK